jgi:hypothetical protein
MRNRPAKRLSIKSQPQGDLVHFCFGYRVKRQHAQSVLTKLKAEGVIEADFRVPQFNRLAFPRLIRLV